MDNKSLDLDMKSTASLMSMHFTVESVGTKVKIKSPLMEMRASVYSGEEEPSTTSSSTDDDVINAEFVDSPQ